jgi:hypothetical protein
MAENPFADLIPQQQQRVNPFADLIPKAAAKPAGASPLGGAMPTAADLAAKGFGRQLSVGQELGVAGEQLGKILPRPSDYMENVRGQQTQGLAALKQGGQQLWNGSGLGARALGGVQAAQGGLQYLGSPIEGLTRTAVGDPVQRATGSSYAGDLADFTAGLLLPEPYGLTKNPLRAAAPAITQKAGAELLGKPRNMFPEGMKPETLELAQRLGAPEEGMKPETLELAQRLGAPEEGMKPETLELAQRLGAPVAARGAESPGQPTRQPVGAMPAPNQTPPSLVPASTEDAKGLLRQRYGLSSRDISMVNSELEQHYKPVARSTAGELWDMVDAVEGQSPASRVKPALQPLMDTMQRIAGAEKDKFQRTYATSGMSFIQDYFPHLYKNDAALQRFIGNVGSPGAGMGHMGSSALTKKRSMFPTWRDARAAGLTPKYDNPIDMWKASYASKSEFIASHEVKEAMQDAGTLRYFAPSKAPEGWAPIQGRFARNIGGEQGYAPAGIASAYNNWYSRSIASTLQNPTAKTVWNSVTSAFNSMRAMKFALSGYHAMTMTTENSSRAFGSAVEDLVSAKPVRSLKDLMDVFPAGVWWRGRQGQAIYRGLLKGDPETEHLINIMAQANPSIGRAFRSPEMEGSLQESLPQMIGRGNLGKNITGGLTKIRDSFVQNGPFKMEPYTDVTEGFVRTFDKTSELMSSWLFRNYIPNLKTGTFMRDLGRWLHDNPTAGQTEQLAAARKISDHLDDIFGEMMKDNLFWPRWADEISQKIMLAPSYNFGTYRALGKGLSGPFRGRSFNPASPRYEPAMGYTIGLVATTAMAAAIGQKVMTGEWPQNLQDILAARTGGTTEITTKSGHYKNVPERLRPYGNVKEAYDVVKALGLQGGTPNVGGYLGSKLNPMMQLGGELLSNKDWRDDPIVTGEPGSHALGQIGGHIAQAFEPISVGQGLFGGGQAGSHIPALLRGTLSPAGRQLTDPEGYRKMQEHFAADAAKKKRKHAEYDLHHQRNEDGR